MSPAPPTPAGEPAPGAPAVEVRPPRGAESAVVRRLLPDLGRAGAPRAALVAIERTPALRYVGAAAAEAALRRRAWHLDVHLRVVEPARRRGVGRALLAALEAAAPLGFAGLSASHPDGAGEAAASAPAAAFLEASGFERTTRESTFEADTARLGAITARLVERLRRAGHMPADARLVPLGAPRLADLLALHLAVLGGTPGPLRSTLFALRAEGAANPSVALIQGERLAGFILLRREGADVFRADARVVAPWAQTGPTNALLLASAVERGAAAGGERFRFASLDGNQDTLKLARRCEARVIGARAFYAKPLDHARRSVTVAL